MRLELSKFLEKLGVSHVLAPYETQPWFHYDEAKAVTCSAEVRMNPGGDIIDAEIQFLHDEKEDEDDDEGTSSGGREQILWLRAHPVQDQWTLKELRIKDKDYVNEFHEWEEKGCDFFLSCVEAMNMGQLPDIDTLVEEKMKDDSWGGGGRRGKIGRKSPKIKPASLLGMKKP